MVSPPVVVIEMREIEYIASGNRIGISVKYPREIPKKWSECFKELQCDSCSGSDISSNKSGDMLIIVCHTCRNFWCGGVDNVLSTYSTDEATVNTNNMTFSEKE